MIVLVPNVKKNESVCESCASEGYDMPFTQLRPCKKCRLMKIKCCKLIVLGISMDCEANNAKAMKMVDLSCNTPLDDIDEPDNSDVIFYAHMRLTKSFPDAVHAGKKLFRAVSNWWLLIDGFHVNNCIIRCLRQFTDCEKLRAVVSDSSLRNRDRMDYGSILETVNPKVAETINAAAAVTSSQLVTITIHL